MPFWLEVGHRNHDQLDLKTGVLKRARRRLLILADHIRNLRLCLAGLRRSRIAAFQPRRSLISSGLFYVRLTPALTKPDPGGDNGTVAKRGLTIAVLACVAALAAPALAGRPLPASVSSYLLGPKLIRAELYVQAGAVQHDYQLDRGRLQKRYANGQLTIVKQSGPITVKVAATARVLLNGKLSSLRALRARMQVAVLHDKELPAQQVWASSKSAPTLPSVVATLLLGNQLVRAEIGVASGDPTTPHDFLIDHGRIKQVGVFTLTLRERDGTIVTINVSPTARVRLNGQNASFVDLRKGMMAMTIHDGDKPADQVYATGG